MGESAWWSLGVLLREHDKIKYKIKILPLGFEPCCTKKFVDLRVKIKMKIKIKQEQKNRTATREGKTTFFTHYSFLSLPLSSVLVRNIEGAS